MKNKDILDYFEKYVDNVYGFVSEECTRAKYGQNTGGYYLNVSTDDGNQKEHFINYYSKFPDKCPSYSYLRCPQLLLFIAEALGVNSKYVEAAYRILRNYEDGLDSEEKKQKSGNYIWGKDVLIKIKVQLKMYEITKILKNTDSIDDAKKQIQSLWVSE